MKTLQHYFSDDNELSEIQLLAIDLVFASLWVLLAVVVIALAVA